MKKRNLFFYLAALMLVLPLLFSFKAGEAKAETSDEVTITLHKLLFKNGQVPDETPNDGKTNPFAESQEMLKDYRGLNGVTFEVYDISDDYYQLRKDGKTAEQAQKSLAASKSGTYVAAQVTQTLNEEDGAAVFTLPKKDKQGRDAVYRFVETDAPSEYVKEKAAPLVAVLPIYDEEENQLDTLALYPKNEEVLYENPPFEKVIREDHEDFELGDHISFQINTQIPADGWNYEDYTINDEAEDALWLDESSVKITVNGTVLSTGFELMPAEHGFALHLAPATLQAHLGQKLQVTYEMVLRGEVVGESVVNEAYVIPGTHQEVHYKTRVKTGGKQFVKVDRKDSSKVLAGAEFVVKNADGKYVQRKDGVNEWVAVTDDLASQKDQLYVLTSNEQGEFMIDGLAFGTYQLQEVKAPKGYVLSKSSVPFEVVEGNLGEAGVPLKVINEQKTDPPKKSNTPDKPKKSGKRLPKTSEAVSSSLRVLGILLILAVGIFFLIKKNRHLDKK